MTLLSLLYVSKSTIPPKQADEVVRQIVAFAEKANKKIAVTGALVFTGTYFAQIIEGDLANMEGLLAKIEQDARHDNLKVIERTIICSRRFSVWSMAYMGPSQFVSRHVTQLLGETNAEQQRRAAAWVADLMAEFTTVPDRAA